MQPFSLALHGTTGSDTLAAPLTLSAMVGIGVCNFFGLNVILTMIKQLGAAQVLL